MRKKRERRVDITLPRKGWFERRDWETRISAFEEGTKKRGEGFLRGESRGRGLRRSRDYSQRKENANGESSSRNRMQNEEKRKKKNVG